MVMTKEQCIEAIGEAFQGAQVTATCDSWGFGIEAGHGKALAVVLMPKFVDRYVDSGSMSANDLTELLKNAPKHAWDDSKGVPMLVLGERGDIDKYWW